MKVTYEQTIDDVKVDSSTGEILEHRQITDVKSFNNRKIENEHDYIKVYTYVSSLFAFKGINQALTPYIIEIANHMTYARDGQIVTLNRPVKDIIAENLGVSTKRLDQVISELRKCDILRKIQNGVYSVNPYICARGQWTDIKKLQSTFDYVTGEMTTVTEHVDHITGTDVKKIISNTKDRKQIPGQLSLQDMIGDQKDEQATD